MLPASLLDLRARVAARLLASEGCCTWMYLDTAEESRVTVGVGHALFCLEDALALPWNQPSPVVAADYAGIATSRSGCMAAWYKPRTKSRLPADAVRELLEADIDKHVSQVREHFIDFDTFPEPAQEAIADMAFNLGGHFPVKLDRLKRPMWPKFRAAVVARDWRTAAAECRRDGISDERNRETRGLFEAAI